MATTEYKQVCITQPAVELLERLKALYAKKGTPMQSPAILGIALNDLAKKMEQDNP